MNTGLLTAIYTQLSTVTSKVYEEEAVTGAEYPYIVYNIVGSVDSYDQDAVLLDVHVWGTGPDTTALNTMANGVRLALDNHTVVNSDVGATFYYNGSNNVADPTEGIRHRVVSFEVQTYYGDSIPN